MTELPEFWRTEVFHPLSVHFPIALLLAAFLFKLVSFWSKKSMWKEAGSLLLLFGVFGIWISIYTGNLANGIVARKICDPTVLKDHQNFAYTTAWIFSGALLLDSLINFIKKEFLKNRLYKLLLVVLLTVGSGFLTYVGHLGATLVYQQGAGVYQPSEDCVEFQ